MNGDKVQTLPKKVLPNGVPFQKQQSTLNHPLRINYRVENLDELVEELKKEGVTITDKIESCEYGKFVHIIDIEGNKVELWEPNDIEYDKIVDGRTK